MKKFILNLFLFLVVCFSFTSCAVTAEAQTEDVYVSNNVIDTDVIIRYGTPYYNVDGLLLYYIYRDYYYYPYYLNDRWYFRSYSRPIRHYRPVPRDFYRHRPSMRHDRRYYGGRSFGSSHHNGGVHRNGGGFNRPNIGGNTHRPNHGMGNGVGSHSKPQMNHSGGNSRRGFGGRR